MLIKICIISAILGIILLVIIADKVSIPSSAIGSLTKQDLNKAVTIKGTVKSITNKETIAIFNIEDKTGSIKAVAFKPNNLTIKKGSFIELEGKLNLYEDNLEIYAETIKILD